MLLAIAFVAGGRAVLQTLELAVTSPPSAQQQSEEVVALQAHVLPLVQELGVTHYLNEGFRGGSLNWKRGNYSIGRDDQYQMFDDATSTAYKQLGQAISESGVATNRLYEAQFMEDGTLGLASFRRRGGGIKYIFKYIYSPGARPPEWTSALGPVILTRIGNSDWWFEQSPDD